MGQTPSTLRDCSKEMSKSVVIPFYPVFIPKLNTQSHFKTEGNCFEFLQDQEREEDREVKTHFSFSLVERYYGENFFSHGLMVAHHTAVISDSAYTVTFPELSEDGRKWVYSGTDVAFDPQDPRSWMKCLPTNSALMPATVRLLMTLERNQHLLMISPRYDSYMQGATDLLEGLRFVGDKQGGDARRLLFQCSGKGASLFKDLPEHTHRVTLCHLFPKEVPWIGKYESCSEVFLDDSGCLNKTVPFALPKDSKIFEEIRYCFNRIKNRLPVLVHCSQGQSRSGLFTSILLTLLHLKGVIELNDEFEDDPTFFRAAMWISKRHLPLHYSECWHTLIDFFIAYELYLDRFFSFSDTQ